MICGRNCQDFVEEDVLKLNPIVLASFALVMAEEKT